MSERVPEGWESKKLGDLGNTFNGLSGKSSKDFGDGEPFINYMQVFRNTLGHRDEVSFVRIDGGEKQSQLRFGDIIFTISSETPEEIGMTSVFLERDYFPYLNSFCFGIRQHDFLKLLPEYGNHLFRGDVFRLAIKPLAQGSTRFNLSKENLKKLQISFPPLPEQKKIASILTSVDEVIETTQKQIDKLQDLKKASMNELLTKGIGHTEFKDSELGRIPKSWEVRKLEELVDPERSVTYGIVQAGKHIETGIPYIRVSDMKFDVLHPKDMLRTSNEIAVKFQRSKVQEGDIVYALRGDVGRVLMVPKSLEGANLTQGTALISKSKQIDTKFFIWCLNSDFVQSQTNDLAKGSTFVEMTLGNLKSIKTTLPPKSEQLKISQILNSISNKISCQKQKLSQTQSLKKSLMQDLLTGKVRVQVN